MSEKKQPIHVLQLGSPTGLYGAERWILALVRHLPAADIQSTVGVLKDAPGQEPELIPHAAAMGIRTHVFEAHGRLSLPAINQLKSYIAERSIDVLHTHGYKTDLLGLLATRGTRCKIISTPHGWSQNAGLKQHSYEMLDRLCFYFLDRVVPLSEDLYRGLSKLPGLRKVQLIQNGVDLSEVDSVVDLDVQLQEWRRQEDFVVGYIGQLIPRKGVDGLLRAFSALPFPNKRLCIVGEGEQRTELERLAQSLPSSERMHFFGFRHDRIAFLKGFDVFVLPSKLEGIPRCVLESMAAHVPVIATDIPGTRNVVREGHTGRLFNIDDHKKLSEILAAMHSNPALRHELAGRAEVFVRSEYSAEAMARSYAALYAALMRGEQPPKNRVRAAAPESASADSNG